MGLLDRVSQQAAVMVRPLARHDDQAIVNAASNRALEGSLGKDQVQWSASRLKQAFAHADHALLASDGKPIRYRTTAPQGAPKALLIMQMGTLGTPEYFDGMGEALAKSGIQSYAIGSRVSAPTFGQHAADLEAVLERARREHPGVPTTVAGVSLGSMIALDWSARHNAEHLPVIAMSPVLATRFLGLKDTLTIGAGMVNERAARIPVNTPMSVGAALTTNPASAEAHLADARDMKVPAGLFDDVGKMVGDVALHGHRMKGPLFIAMAGNDAVAVNGATELFSKLIGSTDKTIETFPGAAHDLSQETNHPDLVNALQTWILGDHKQP